MSIDWSPLVAMLRHSHRLFLTTHVRPDCDGLGSMLALGEALQVLGKQVHLVSPSPMPPRYQFLDPAQTIAAFQPPGSEYAECDTLLILDTGTWNQLDQVGAFVRASPARKAIIDHHRTQDDLGGPRYVDVNAESTGRLALALIDALGVPLSTSMARNIFVALAMDTGWFRHANTTPAAFTLAARLSAAGAQPTALYEALFERNSLARYHLMSRALGRMETLAQGRVAFAEVRFADYTDTGSIPLDSEDLVNFPRALDGVEIALLLMEQRDGSLKASFRSRAVDVSKIAERFGGGGHRLAAGAILPGPFDQARAQILHAVVSAFP